MVKPKKTVLKIVQEGIRTIKILTGLVFAITILILVVLPNLKPKQAPSVVINSDNQASQICQKINQEDVRSLFSFYVANERYQEAQNFLLVNGDKFDDLRRVAGSIKAVGEKLAIQKTLEFLERMIEEEPENFSLRLQRRNFLNQLG